jgi:hypothetical protein
MKVITELETPVKLTTSEITNWDLSIDFCDFYILIRVIYVWIYVIYVSMKVIMELETRV